MHCRVPVRLSHYKLYSVQKKKEKGINFGDDVSQWECLVHHSVAWQGQLVLPSWSSNYAVPMEKGCSTVQGAIRAHSGKVFHIKISEISMFDVGKCVH